MMKWTWLIAVALAADLQAGELFKPVRSGNMADVNGKMIDPSTLEMKTIPPQYYDATSAPLNGKRVPFKRADTKNIPIQRLDLPGREIEILPQQNFSAKRASQSDRRADTRVLPEKRAPTPNRTMAGRTIHATTAQGEEELKDQLNNLQVRPKDDGGVH